MLLCGVIVIRINRPGPSRLEDDQSAGERPAELDDPIHEGERDGRFTRAEPRRHGEELAVDFLHHADGKSATQ